MANADKCWLNIPFKGVIQSLAQSIDADGKIDPAALKLAGDREFENYKAIERRINDPGCVGGGCCAEGFSRAVTFSGTITPSSSDNLTLGSDSFDFYTTASGGSTFQAGMWSLSLYLAVTFATQPVTGNVYASMQGNGTSSGGKLRGQLDLQGWAFVNAGFTAVGGYYDEAAWAPAISIDNGTDRNITSMSGTLTGFRFCDPCDPVTIVPGGG